jgi:hypothetical protein
VRGQSGLAAALLLAGAAAVRAAVLSRAGGALVHAHAANASKANARRR